MTTEAFNPSDAYLIAGIGPYAIGHEYTAASIEVWVELDGQLIQLAEADYTLTPTEADVSGDLHLTTGAAATYAGGTLFISRNTDPEQGWLAVSGERERSLELQLDHLTRAVQDVRAGLARAVRLPTGRAALPFLAEDSAARAARVIAFSDDGLGLIVGPSSEEVANANGYAVAAGNSAVSASNSATAAAGSAGSAAAAATAALSSAAVAESALNDIMASLGVAFGDGVLTVNAQTQRVGINAASPAVTLDISGDGLMHRLKSSISENAYTRWDSQSHRFVSGLVGGKGYVGTETLAPISLKTNSADRIYIDAVGLVGIGLGSSQADARLHVSNGVTAGVHEVATFVGGSSGGLNDEAVIRLSSNVYNSNLRGAAISAKNATGATQAHDLLFYTNPPNQTPSIAATLSNDGFLSVPRGGVVVKPNDNGDKPFLNISNGGTGKNYLLVQQKTEERNDSTTAQIQRNVNSHDGWSNPKALRVKTNVNVDTSQTEWAVSAELDNYSNTASAGNTALSGVANKFGLGAVFGLHVQAKDYNHYAAATDVTTLVGGETNAPSVGLDHPTANSGYGRRRLHDFIARTNEDVATWNNGTGNAGAGETGVGVMIRTDNLTDGYFRYGLVVDDMSQAANPNSIGTGIRVKTSGDDGVVIDGINPQTALRVAPTGGTGGLYGMRVQGDFGIAAIAVDANERIQLGVNGTTRMALQYNLSTNSIEFLAGASVVHTFNMAA